MKTILYVSNCSLSKINYALDVKICSEYVFNLIFWIIMPWIYERPNEYVVFCFDFYVKKSLSGIVLISI